MSKPPSKPPSEPTVRVVAAVIERDGCYLVCERPLHKRHGGLWEFPGGKCEPDESDLDAARRELREELGVHVTRVGAPIHAVHDEGSPFLIVFIPAEIEGEPVPHEHNALRWCAVGELHTIALAPSDRCFAERLARAGTREGPTV